MELLRLFSDNLLPVFLAAGVGYLLAARGGIDPRPLNRVVFNVFAPCMIVRLVVENQVTLAVFLRVGLVAFVTLGSVSTAAWFLARRLGQSRSMAAAIALVVLIPNSGNFGLSANLFAFGEPGLAQATIFFVASMMISYTAGVLIASAGRAGIATALAGVVKVPTIWSLIAAFTLAGTGTSLPAPVERTVWLLGDATIPTMLMILGVQLFAARRGAPAGALWLATGFRLAGGLLTALLVCRFVGLDGAARQAAVFQSAMPTAVICTILATEYDLEPAFVARVVFLTTLLSPLTLTPLLQYLKG